MVVLSRCSCAIISGYVMVSIVLSEIQRDIICFYSVMLDVEFGKKTQTRNAKIELESSVFGHFFMIKSTISAATNHKIGLRMADVKVSDFFVERNRMEGIGSDLYQDQELNAYVDMLKAVSRLSYRSVLRYRLSQSELSVRVGQSAILGRIFGGRGNKAWV